jgi:hypothetical protein
MEVEMTSAGKRDPRGGLTSACEFRESLANESWSLPHMEDRPHDVNVGSPLFQPTSTDFMMARVPTAGRLRSAQR